MRILDTDVLVDILRNRPEAVNWLESTQQNLVISGFSVMELVQGTRSRAELRTVSRTFEAVRRIWPDDEDCEYALKLLNEYYPSHGIGFVDCLIAASTIRFDATLITWNLKHYSAIPELSIEQPYSKQG